MVNRSETYFNEKTQIVINKVEEKIGAVNVEKLPCFLSLSTSSKVTGQGNKSLCAWSTTPILSCPGSTETCREGCYGCSGNFKYPNVKTQQYRNLMIFSRMLNEGKQLPLVEGLISLIKNSPAYYAGQFRLFEVGDFYNQSVVDVWQEVISRLPEVKFWAYTRSFHLDFAGLISLANITLLASSDPDNSKQARSFADLLKLHVAYVLAKGETEPKPGSILCPHQTGKVHSCWDCGLCFKGKLHTDISFLYH